MYHAASNGREIVPIGACTSGRVPGFASYGILPAARSVGGTDSFRELASVSHEVAGKTNKSELLTTSGGWRAADGEVRSGPFRSVSKQNDEAKTKHFRLCQRLYLLKRFKAILQLLKRRAE